jgi:hypothetical protein
MNGNSTFLIATLENREALGRAEALLQVARRSSDAFEQSSAAGAAVIVAIAFLDQSVEYRLIRALAYREIEEGRYPELGTIKEELPPRVGCSDAAPSVRTGRKQGENPRAS